MSVYTPLSADDIQGILANYDIGDIQAFTGITAGTVNSNFALETSKGKYVLTLFEVLDLDQVTVYLRLQQYLAWHGVRCPEPVVSRSEQLAIDYNGKPLAVMPMVTGETATAVNTSQCKQIAAMLARWHLIGTRWQPALPNPFNHNWVLQTAATVADSLPETRRGLLQQALDRQTTKQSAYAELPRGAIHADIFRDNVLFNGDELTGIIDFYYSCTEHFLWDLGILLNDWCFDEAGVFQEAHAKAILEAYQAVRPLKAVEQAELIAVCQQVALRFWLSRLDSELQLEDNISITIKDPEEFAKKLEFWMGHPDAGPRG